MARGWESKSVESQMEAAEERRVAAQEAKRTQEELRLERQRDSLRLSRERIVREMEEARHPRHKEQLAAALAHLDEQLTRLTST
jgi:hypothetical protein